MTGGKPAEFDYTLPSGTTAHYRPDGVLTVIEFGDPDCDDCRFAKLKMETDVEFSELTCGPGAKSMSSSLLPTKE